MADHAKPTPLQLAKSAVDEKYFANGILNREEHQRLVDNIDNVARVANIAREIVFTSPVTLRQDDADLDEGCFVRGISDAVSRPCRLLAQPKAKQICRSPEFARSSDAMPNTRSATRMPIIVYF
jgi:hypothetical protein